MVLSRDESGSEIRLQPIEQTFQLTADCLTVLTFEDRAGHTQIIRTTPEHPFWVRNRNEFLPAQLLGLNDEVIGPNGEVQFVTRSELEEHPDGIAVYNLRVTDFHTYFVAQSSTSTPLLVHNANYNEDAADGAASKRVDATDNLAKPVNARNSTPSLREQYLGRTPGKGSRTGRQVIERMELEGNLRWNSNGCAEVRYVDPVTKAESWHPLNSTDMGHLHDAMKFWNETGRTLGPKHPDVRQWMLDPAHFALQPSSINRANGAKLPDRYLPPLGEE